MEKSGEALDHEVEMHQREQEMEEGSKASTSFDQWEVHSMDAQISKLPNASDPHESGDMGLSKSFRISIIVGSILIMIAVILAISVFLPHNSKHNQKLQHGRNLLSNSSSNNGVKHLTEIRVSFEVTQFYSLCISAMDSSESRSQKVILNLNFTTADSKCLEFLQMEVFPNITSSENSNEEFIMHIRTGVYQDMVRLRIPSTKFNLMVVGSNGINTTIIMGNPTGDSAMLGLERNVIDPGNLSFKSKEEESKSPFYCDCRILEGNAAFQWIFKSSYSALSSQQSSRDRTHVSGLVFENCSVNVTQEYFLDPQVYSS